MSLVKSSKYSYDRKGERGLPFLMSQQLKPTLAEYEKRHAKYVRLICVCLTTISIYFLFLVKTWNVITILSIIIGTLLWMDVYLYQMKNTCTVGLIPISIGALFFFSLALCFQRGDKFLFILCCIICFFPILFFLSKFFVLSQALKTNRKLKEGDTVLILGTEVMHGKPSPTLQRRLDTAIKIYNETKINIIVSGGKQTDKSISEAEVMKKYLLFHGIPEGKIYVEDKANSTKQNLQFAEKIVIEKHLNKEIFVLSSDYHMYRVKLLVQGKELSTISSKTPLLSFLPEWNREVLILTNLHSKK